MINTQKNTRINFTIAKDDYEKLKEIAKEEKLSVSAFIRLTLAKVIKSKTQTQTNTQTNNQNLNNKKRNKKRKRRK
jgi:predicted CopG family antitoxin